MNQPDPSVTSPKSHDLPAASDLARFRWAFTLSGGAAQGAYTAGVIEAFRLLGLFDQPDTVRILHGVSTGALVGTLVATGEFDRLREIYTTVTTRDILRPSHRLLYNLTRENIVPVFAACALFGPPYVFSSQPLQRIIADVMGSDDSGFARLIDRRDEIEIGYTSVNLQSGRTRCFTNQEESVTPRLLREALLASSNQPVLMDLVEVGPDRAKHCDGGVRQLLPFEHVTRSRFADELDVIVCVMLDPPKPKTDMSEFSNIADILRRTLELLSYTVGEHDIPRGLLADAMFRCRHLIVSRLGAEAWEELESGFPAPMRDAVEDLVAPMRRAYEYIRIQPARLDFVDPLKFVPDEMHRAWDLGISDTQRIVGEWWEQRGRSLKAVRAPREAPWPTP